MERQNLTNSDFRDLLTTPKRNNQASEPHVDKDAQDSLEESDKVLENLALKYKDRAKERRDGFRSLQQEMSMHMSMQSSTSSKNPSKITDLISSKVKTTINESKYLGGDMEHAHLVKGLDYVLLDKKFFQIKHEMKYDTTTEENESLMTPSLNDNTYSDQIIKAYEAQSQYSKENLSKKFTRTTLCCEYNLEKRFSEFRPPTAILSSGAPSSGCYLEETIDISEAVKVLEDATSYLESYTSAQKVIKNDHVKVENIYDDVGSDYVPVRNLKKPGNIKSEQKLFENTTQIKAEQNNRVITSHKLDKLKKTSDTIGYDECYPNYTEDENLYSFKKHQNKRNKNSYYDNQWTKIQDIIKTKK
ncbi:MAG: hypothetical protein MHPSP_002090 [Paramarteilia canceri]